MARYDAYVTGDRKNFPGSTTRITPAT